MSTPIRSITRTKSTCSFPVGGVINALHNMQMKIDDAAGAATALEMRLRFVAEMVQEVQDELGKQTSDSFYEAKLFDLIAAVMTVFQDRLTDEERQKIEDFALRFGVLGFGLV